MFNVGRGIEILYFRPKCLKCGWTTDRIYQGEDKTHCALANIEYDRHTCYSDKKIGINDNLDTAL